MAKNDSWKVDEEHAKELFCQMATVACKLLRSSRRISVKKYRILLYGLENIHLVLFDESLLAKMVMSRPVDAPEPTSANVLPQLKQLEDTTKSGHTLILKKLDTLQRTANGEHVKVNEKCAENRKRVRDALERYYKLIGNPKTNPRSATSSACESTRKSLGLGAYRSFGSFRGAVAREIAYRLRRYGDKASDLTLQD